MFIQRNKKIKKKFHVRCVKQLMRRETRFKKLFCSRQCYRGDRTMHLPFVGGRGLMVDGDGRGGGCGIR